MATVRTYVPENILSAYSQQLSGLLTSIHQWKSSVDIATLSKQFGKWIVQVASLDGAQPAGCCIVVRTLDYCVFSRWINFMAASCYTRCAPSTSTASEAGTFPKSVEIGDLRSGHGGVERRCEGSSSLSNLMHG